DRLGIRDIGKVIDPKTKNLHPVMHYIYRHHRNIAYAKALVLNLHTLYTGSSGIFILGGKNIIETFLKGAQHSFMCVNRNISLFEKIRTDIIQSGGMITVFMGK